MPGFGAVIFRRTSPQITNEGGLWDVAGEIYPKFGATPNQGSLEWKFPPYGNVVSFRHLQHEQNKYDWQGTQIACLCFDEVSHFSESQFFYLLSRNRSTCGIRPYVRATCNPDPGWLKTFLAPWVDKEFDGKPAQSGEVRSFIRSEGRTIWVNPGHPDAKTLSFVRASVYDNKILLEKDPGYLANLKALSPIERARLLDGDWDVRREGLVYPGFPECLVESAPDGTGNQQVGGLDFGFNNPFAAVWGFVDSDDVLWITGCRYQSHTTIPVHSEALPRGVRWSADPAGAEHIAELRNAGHDVIPCVHRPMRGASGETKKPLLAGIDLVTERMRTGRLKIVRSACLPLVRELQTYHYDPEKRQEEPVKEDDHSADALRYLCTLLDRGRAASPVVPEDQARAEFELMEAELDRLAKESYQRDAIAREEAARQDIDDPRWWGERW